MRLLFVMAAAAIVAAPAAAKPMSPLQRETAVWQAFKNKTANVFSAMFAPNYVGLYEDGIYPLAHEVQTLKSVSLRSYKISNFSSRMIDDDDMLVTYLVDERGTLGKTDISGRYWAASVWHRSGNNWTTVYHNETKAK